MSAPVLAWVALGSNLGTREDHLAWARERLGGASRHQTPRGLVG